MKILPLLLGIFAHAIAGAQTINTITVDCQKQGAAVPPMYGVFYEEIGHAGEGGLYAELLRNRSFEDNTLISTASYKDGHMIAPHLISYYPPRAPRTGGYVNFGIKFDTSFLQGWKLKASKNIRYAIRQTTIAPLFSTSPHNIELTVSGTRKGESISLVNSGFAGFDYSRYGKPYSYNVYHDAEVAASFGIGYRKGEKYKLRMVLKTDGDYKGNIIAALLDSNERAIARQVLKVKNSNNWQELACEFQPSETISKGKFSVSFNAAGKVWIDFVSLMPVSTFHNRTNGLRNDVAEMIASLKPGFIRWPGGCVVEGLTLANRFNWKETLGDPASRPGNFGLWGYRNSYGFGYHEYLQYCEDIGASAMFVCNAGMSCVYRNGDYCSRDSVSFFIQDVLDAIEYAIGDTKTVWGSKRAEAGHPAPFPLQYIEVGNEDHLMEYADRYDMFYKAIRKKYPQLTIIANYDIDEANEYSAPGRKVDMIDPHWYDTPEFFFSNFHKFDSLTSRKDYKIYVGEYAANAKVGAGNMEGALSEATFAMGMERNSDLVKMCSYAPLLQHESDTTWAVNLIIMSPDKVYGRSSYYVQKMLSENRPDVNLTTTFSDAGEKLRHYAIAGYDKKTNEIIIKVVNGESTTLKTIIDLKNAGELAEEGKAIVLSASSAKEENSFSEPLKISPAAKRISSIKNSFEYEFKPYSFTVLRIKKTSSTSSQ